MISYEPIALTYWSTEMGTLERVFPEVQTVEVLVPIWREEPDDGE